jgi:hypothetical protein
MISRIESQKIFFETRDGNIDIEPRSSGLPSSLRVFIYLEIDRPKDKFLWALLLSHFEIIKIHVTTKVI